MTASTWRIDSPDGRVTMDIRSTVTAEGSSLSFRVLHDGVEAVMPSPLGFGHTGAQFVDVAVADVSDVETIDQAYRLAHGKQLEVRSIAHERVVTLRNVGGYEAQLVARACNDGIAFRYRAQIDDEPHPRLTGEVTEFRLGDGRAWIQPHDAAAEFTPAYEALHADGIPIGTPEPGPSWNMPALFRTRDRWVLIAEADLIPPAVGMHLSSRETGAYRVVPPAADEGSGVGDLWPVLDERWESAWRVVVVASGLDTIVETTMITDLATPSQVEDTDWVVPGRSSWSWWSNHDSPQSLPELYRYADFAAEMEWEHTLVDANWDVHSDEEIQHLVAHARDRGVGVWLWYNSGGPHNVVTERPRDRMHDSAVRRTEFAKLAEWGVAGVKVDFFQSDKPEIIELMWDVLADAAEHEIMVNLHGCTVPRGWQRTWPHMVSVEGVRGGEQYAFAPEFPETAIWHNTILPYTRNVIGPMDYTPVTVSDQLYPHLTSTAHEIALGLLYESGVQHYADSIETYRSLPEEAIGLLKRAPAIWDETRHVDGFPGSHCVIARRSGGSWYVAGIAGPTPVTVTVDATWLDGERTGMLLMDAAAGSPSITKPTVSPTSSLTVAMPARGGFVLELR